MQFSFVQVVRLLIATGHDVHVVTSAPEFVFTTEIKSPNLHIRKVLLDYGSVQDDALKDDLVLNGNGTTKIV
ncbi:hypothetical protein ABZP36_027223 [Zizania latifolia]